MGTYYATWMQRYQKGLVDSKEDFKYRNRLIAAGLIESDGYGKVDFAIPGLRQYVRK